MDQMNLKPFKQDRQAKQVQFTTDTAPRIWREESKDWKVEGVVLRGLNAACE